MDSKIAVCLSLAMAALLGANAFGQTVALPQPVAVVKDADGKVVGQVVGFVPHSDLGFRPVVMLSIDGELGLFVVRTSGLERASAPRVYFSEPGCVGSAYLMASEGQPVLPIEDMTGVRFDVLGPDPSSGTYRVYRSTFPEPQWLPFLSSQYPGQECHDLPPGNSANLMSIEEMTPNPLAGFHGPTAANPERIWTIEGGDRIQ